MEAAVANLALLLVGGVYVAAAGWGLLALANRIWGPPRPAPPRRRRPF